MHFRFTIRDLLWLTLVVAMGVGWWVDLRSTRNRLAELEHEWGVMRKTVVEQASGLEAARQRELRLRELNGQTEPTGPEADPFH